MDPKQFQLASAEDSETILLSPKHTEFKSNQKKKKKARGSNWQSGSAARLSCALSPTASGHNEKCSVEGASGGQTDPPAAAAAAAVAERHNEAVMLMTRISLCPAGV